MDMEAPSYEGQEALIRKKERYRRCIRALAEMIAYDCEGASVLHVEDELFEFAAKTICDNDPVRDYEAWQEEHHAYQAHIESEIDRRKDG